MTWKPETDPCNLGIVDDDVYFSLQPPELATHAAADIAAIVFSEYARARLTLHLQPSKTAANFVWAGVGSIAARKQCEAR